MSFIVLFPTAVTQVIAIAGERRVTRRSQAGPGDHRPVLAVAAGQVLARGTGGSIFGFFRELTASRAGVWMQAPFDVFRAGHHGTAFYPEFAGWSAVAFVIDAFSRSPDSATGRQFFSIVDCRQPEAVSEARARRRGQVWANLARPSGARWLYRSFPVFAGPARSPGDNSPPLCAGRAAWPTCWQSSVLWWRFRRS